MTTWLILDVSCLVYRSFYAMGDLSYNGARTGGVFGLFRDIQTLQEIYPGGRFVFCFDVGRSLRKQVFPAYKSARAKLREDMDQEKREALSEVQNQLTRLRTKYLPYMGYRNVFYQEGYEADDVIASVCLTLTSDAWMDRVDVRDSVVVVSSDSDLYQLLAIPNVSIWNPRTRKVYTWKTFAEDYGLSATKWARVKAIGGCSSDNIPGVPGVGEKTAIKFLRAELHSGSEKFKRITNAQKDIEFYFKLTKLPYPGTDEFVLRDDAVTNRRWRKAMERLGMASLRGRVSGVKG